MWQRIGEIVSCLHKGVTIADADGRFVYADTSCPEMFGVAPAQIIGRTAYALEEDGTFSPCITALVLRDRQRVTSVQRLRDGRESFVTGIPIYEGDGSISAVICYSSWEIRGYEDLQARYEQLQAENRHLQEQYQELVARNRADAEVILRSKSSRDNLRLLQKFASARTPVLISGPAGSGKRFLALHVYDVAHEYNCEHMSEEMLLEDLFGDGPESLSSCSGRLLLLHIEHLPMAVQNRLVAYVKAHEHPEIIATADATLAQMRRDGTVSDEFYYLFRVCEVTTLPLCERVEDLNGYLEYYLARYNERYDRHVVFTPGAMRCLLNYGWQDNVNEVKYTLERIVLTAEDDRVDAHNLPANIADESAERFRNASLHDAMEFYEKGIVVRAYEQYRTTVRVAERLGISQATAVRKLQKYVEHYNS